MEGQRSIWFRAKIDKTMKLNKTKICNVSECADCLAIYGKQHQFYCPVNKGQEEKDNKEVIREQVGEKKDDVVEIDGQKVRGSVVQEKEIDIVHLKKIAPMWFYCSDNNKVVMVPFSIQFSMADFFKHCAEAATNMEKELEAIQNLTDELVKSGDVKK